MTSFLRGGMKESGIGRENGIEAFESCEPQLLDRSTIFELCVDSQSKSTIVNIATAEETRQADDWFGEEPNGRRYG